MGLKFRGLIGPKNIGADVPVVQEKQPDAEGQQHGADKELDPAVNATGATESSQNSLNEQKDLQFGVQAAEATLQVWTKQHLIAAYLCMWLINFVNAFSSGVAGTLTTYAVSDFSMHSLVSTTSILSGLIPGLTKLAYAKYIDNFGRPQGFILAFSTMTIGLIMFAACNNVETYCAAAVFYYTGYSWIDFTVTIFIADTSKLKNRAFMIAYVASPWLITTWVYGLACDQIVAEGGIGWRWGFGIMAIITPVVCAPLWALFYFNQRKAIKRGLVHVKPHGRSVLENIIFYGKEFDIIGILLAAFGIGLFLLSFSLYSYQTDTWRSPLIICFLIFGGLLIIAFVCWERFLAPVTFIPWYLIKNRTVFFTYSMIASLYTAWYLWDNYFYSFCIVVFDLSVQNATYMGNVYTIGSTFWAILFGILIRYNGRLKWPAVYFGVPMTILGVGLMIHFRQPDVNVGYVVMCLIFIAFGGGTLVICEQMTVMAVSKHKDIPAILAMEGMVAAMGQSIGSTIAAAMWTGIFPKKLAEYLPADALPDLTTIYGDITVQSSYAVGTPTRDGINQAYGATQRLMLITAVCMYSITWASTFMWESINVKEIQQYNGAVMW
ncbi:putative Siderophore iron transporter-like protein [Seiridium unicorne]|uniref:Siderophore iron transporter-like protein n=1 Tax=Seiridium unicorne TaxID=138068 RepID=A0ABR2UQE8_9PEZI